MTPLILSRKKPKITPIGIGTGPLVYWTNVCKMWLDFIQHFKFDKHLTCKPAKSNQKRDCNVYTNNVLCIRNFANKHKCQRYICIYKYKLIRSFKIESNEMNQFYNSNCNFRFVFACECYFCSRIWFFVCFNVSFCSYRFGANWNPRDRGIMPIIAILDKLVESPQNQLHVELCLKILLKTVKSIEMPYKVSTLFGMSL